MVNLPGEAKSDVDLVVCVSNINLLQFKSILDSLLSTFVNLLKQHPTLGLKITDLYSTKWAVRFCVDHTIRVDLLPTFVVPPAFRIQDVPPSDRPWFSVCFSKQQKIFVKQQATATKDWVRLVKLWAHQFQWPEHCQPKSYLLELIVISIATLKPCPSGPRELMQRFFALMTDVKALAIFFGHRRITFLLISRTSKSNTTISIYLLHC